MNYTVKCLLFLYRCFACAAAVSESKEKESRDQNIRCHYFQNWSISPLLSFRSAHHIYSAVIISDIQWHTAAAFGMVRAQRNKYESILAFPLMLLLLLTVCFVELLCCVCKREASGSKSYAFYAYIPCIMGNCEAWKEGIHTHSTRAKASGRYFNSSLEKLMRFLPLFLTQRDIRVPNNFTWV
jgi:hypothetical protein